MAKPVNYQALNNELEIVLVDLQRDNIDVDTALKQYERGLEIVRLLETHLQTAENKITELQANFSKD